MEFALVELVVLTLVLSCGQCEGHGRLLVPPARTGMWREGFPTPVEYSDSGANCGGSLHQWGDNDGMCGICGDPYEVPRPRPLEHGGRFGTGAISRIYIMESDIDVQVQITAPHMGYFEFRLCSLDDGNAETIECLNENLLAQPNGTTRWYAGTDAATHIIMLKLPEGVRCNQCVLQWKWHTGNSWGTDDAGSGIGHGAQEEFYGCADIQILGSGETTTVKPITGTPLTTTTTTEPPKPEYECTFVPPAEYDPEALYPGITPHLDELCVCDCNMDTGKCSTSLCKCSDGVCRLWVASFQYSETKNETTLWCNENCPKGEQFCPQDKCICTTNSATIILQSLPLVILLVSFSVFCILADRILKIA